MCGELGKIYIYIYGCRLQGCGLGIFVTGLVAHRDSSKYTLQTGTLKSKSDITN